MKRSPLKRKTPLRKMSKAKAVEYGKYVIKRARLLKNAVCEWPAITCTSAAEDVHHLKGRAGKMLNDERYFLLLCRSHHRYIHDHAREARKMGLLK